MKQNKRIWKRLFGAALSAAMMLGLMPGTGMTTLADSAKAYSAYDVTTPDNVEAITIPEGGPFTDEERNRPKQNLSNMQVTFNNKPWYIIEDNSNSVSSGTVTLLAADDSFGSSKFSNSNSNVYADSLVKSLLDGLTEEGGNFYDVSDAIVKNTSADGKLYLLSVSEAQPLNISVLMMYDRIPLDNSTEPWGNNTWWLGTAGTSNDQERVVSYESILADGYGGLVTQTLGVRPALILDLSKVSFNTNTKEFSMVPVTPYPLWVGGTQVTSANAANITGATTPTASYDATSNTLTLNNANITSGYQFQNDWGKAGIYYEAKDSYDALNIVLEGDNIISGDDIGYGMCGGYNFYGKFIFSGSGTLTTKGTSSGIYMRNAAGGVQIDGGTINASGDSLSGIYTRSSVVINDGTVKAKGSKQGINGSYGVSIKGGNVTAIAEIDNYDDAAAIYGFNGKHSFTGGTVIVKGGKYGIRMDGSNDIEIGPNVTSVTISGTTAAIKTNYKVKNFVAGMGWSNVDGTGDGTEIAVNTSGASLDSYKKLLFPYTKSAATVTTHPTAKTLTYTGSPQTLVNAGSASGGTMQYTLGTSSSISPESSMFTPDIPQGKDAETYYVWYMAKGDNTHTDSDPKCVTVTISKVSEHQHKIELVDATEPGCETNGNKAHYKCTECGKLFEDKAGQSEITEESIILKAKGHKWDDGVITKEATYDETGIKTFTCENDSSHTREEELPRKTRAVETYERESDTDNSDGSSGSSGSSSNKSSTSTNAEIQAKIDQINTGSSVVIPENHQVESGLPVSDVGGNWGNNADIWTYTKSDGTVAKAEWMNLDYNGLSYWYYFDSNGIMQTNWFDYNNERFYLMPEKDGWRGRMATGWKNIENKWYYFETVPGSLQGRLYRSTVTPDGHTVGDDGSWDGVGTTPIGQK